MDRWVGGTLTLAPLFEPLEQALLSKLRSEQHRHADETRWQVFVEVVGKVGHRWYLWVFHSPAVIHFMLDESRSSEVPVAEVLVAELTAGMSPAQGGIISCCPLLGVQEVRARAPRVCVGILLG